jgi:hypothetical protein
VSGPRLYECTSERCGWQGPDPACAETSALTASGRVMICPRCYCPARAVRSAAPALPMLARVPVTADLIGGMELALGLIDTAFAAGQLAPGAGQQINELRRLHVQLLANRVTGSPE